FPNLPPGSYTVCEKSNPGFITNPCVTVQVAQCAPQVVNFINNEQPNTPNCPEDPKAAITKSVTGVAGANTFVDLSSAVAAAVAADVIGMFINTNENVVIKPPFAGLIITQCTLGKVTALDNGAPTIDIQGNNKVTINSLETSGGSVGFLIEGNGHVLKAVR